ncbi:propionyl-CoA carboxylase beta chain [Micromonospora profundi]|uniref:acyl-CoA carboxylase subunit beta n=1 Tax=Micromonospora profundi TaxID=1420889 RepID=UPI00143985E6|nr:carboxyl transferase domain-containing protein [Micromonospora profundi]NJC12963.1 propionyl-CoA carboxylase beta chain [Micromonospora profundi]
MKNEIEARPATLAEETERYLAWKEATLDHNRPEALAAQRKRGALTARERVTRFVDPASFVEFGQLGRPDTEDPFDDEIHGAADGIVIGTGRVDGRPVVVVSYDFTVSGGSMGRTNDEKFARARQISLRSGVPLVMFVEGGGARITERMGSTTIRGHERFSDLGLMSGWAPILCGVVGHTYAGHANLVALADYVVMVKGASLGLAGPRLVKAATGEDVSTADFGSELHAKEIGSIDHETETEDDLVAHLRRYLSYLPSNCTKPAPRHPYQPTDERLDDSVLSLVSANQARAYDMRRLVRKILDEESGFELKPTFAPNLVTTFGRMGGHTVGVIANNPLFKAGVLDGNASDKMSRFINICDAFNIPLVWLVDVPGYIVGTAAERTNLFRRSMRPLWELSQSTVPICTIVVRKAFGLAYHTMGGAEFHPALMVCWPSARVSPMGAEGAVNILHGKDPTVTPEQRRELIDHYKRLEEPAVAGAKFKIDDVIDPRDTRQAIIRTLDFIADSRHESGHWRPPKKRGIAPA